MNNVRLDQYVLSKLEGLSRASVAKLIQDSKVLVNDLPQTKPGYRLRANDQVIINYKVQQQPDIESIDLEVIYEDDDCVVINKPLGLLSHSKGAFNPEPTVASWLASRYRGEAGERAGIVHRLDRATSGVMICAKTPEALSWLQKQFSLRKTKKVYLAIIKGELETKEALIDLPLERNPKKPQTFRVSANGKTAETTYKVIKESSGYSLIELRPTTGRTHQLRVHLKYLNKPIVGDTLYGGEPAERMYLHAKSLEITVPSRERKVFETPMPKSFEAMLSQ
jgi:23S rRNA pseudouridine1911/1915/1917 synthase